MCCNSFAFHFPAKKMKREPSLLHTISAPFNHLIPETSRTNESKFYIKNSHSIRKTDLFFNIYPSTGGGCWWREWKKSSGSRNNIIKHTQISGCTKQMPVSVGEESRVIRESTTTTASARAIEVSTEIQHGLFVVFLMLKSATEFCELLKHRQQHI